MNWESLIASRMRPCATICAIEDPVKRAKKMKEDRRAKKPERIAYKKKWREEHRDELNAKKRAYRATPEGKCKSHEENKKWREENKEYDKERKAKWWRLKHPNPNQPGRPKKVAA
jgi:hypothetical protein